MERHPLTGNQLIELIWLLFHEDLKLKNTNIDDWWYTPFKCDEFVLDRDELLNKLSVRCGDVLADHPDRWEKAGLKKPNKDRDPGDHCIEECRSIISAVLQSSSTPALGFRWTFVSQKSSTAVINTNAKERFRTLIASCRELITR